MGELRQGSGSSEETVCEHADGAGGCLAERATQNSHCVQETTRGLRTSWAKERFGKRQLEPDNKKSPGNGLVIHRKREP